MDDTTTTPSSTTSPPPPAGPILDTLGIFWITWTCAYTSLLALGLLYLFLHRAHPSIRIRNPLLTILAVSNLHVYWILCALGYVLGPVYPEILEYWIMNIYFPMGLALFQAANARLLAVARGQARCFSAAGSGSSVGSQAGGGEKRGVGKSGGGRRSWFALLRERWGGASEWVRMGWYIALALLVQVRRSDLQIYTHIVFWLCLGHRRALAAHALLAHYH